MVGDGSGTDEDTSRLVAHERERVAADLRAVVVEHLHRLEAAPDDEVGHHAAAALDATDRAAALGGLPDVPSPEHHVRWPWVVLATVTGAVALALVALVVVLLPGSVASGPLLVLGLAVAIAATARHAPPVASGAGLALVLAVLAVAAPFATTAVPAAGAVAGAVDLPIGAEPEAGACLLLGVVLAAAWGCGLYRRRCAIASRRRRWLGTVDALGRCRAHARLGLSTTGHRTLVDELAVLTSGGAEARRMRVARHRLDGVLPALTAVDLTPGSSDVVDAVLDEGRVAVLVAAAQQSVLAGAPWSGRPPSVVVCGVPATERPEVGLLAARLLADLVADVASHAGPVPASVSVEHRADAVALEVASGRGRGSGAGRTPVALEERAALLGGTVEVTSTTGALSVRVVLPTGTRVEVAPVEPVRPVAPASEPGPAQAA
ncbi:hypothetical protein [Actinomycetospora termitidis]|uniref:Signal transduction histidine kinase n=1 Tax=Actinomycetospora termitidis TaxID=3053470 RepID=A0ABT7M6Q0_9PSEU|nr:hypothetical protein [Actinomycetospora sp. Odt1-22]MDL5156353.1 hypothetical protein [Actinomycetospora sp. Odt1-22]